MQHRDRHTTVTLSIFEVYRVDLKSCVVRTARESRVVILQTYLVRHGGGPHLASNGTETQNSSHDVPNRNAFITLNTPQIKEEGGDDLF